MKDEFLEYFRAFFVSLEFLAILALPVIFRLAPKVAMTLLDFLRSLDAAGLLGILAVPFALLAATYKMSDELLGANESHRKELLRWKDYWKLRARQKLALSWCALGCALNAVGLLLLGMEFDDFVVVLVMQGVCVASVATASVALARMKVRDLLDDAPGS